MPLTLARVAPLQMQWCLSCHRNPGEYLHPHDQVFAMPAPPVSSQEASALARLAHLESERRLTDCSTCHR